MTRSGSVVAGLGEVVRGMSNSKLCQSSTRVRTFSFEDDANTSDLIL